MKRIISLILILCLILSLTGCFYTNDSNDNSNKNSTNNTTNNTNNNSNKPKYHTIKFDTNGGTRLQDKTAKTLNSAPETSRKGYLFNGWYLDETLTQGVVFPLSIDKDMTIYAKWLKTSDTAKCADVSIKLGTGYNSAVFWYITPSGFDLDELALKEYYLEIIVTYEVFYEKDYDVLWDIGYAGSPKYEAYILNSDKVGTVKEDLSTSKETTKRSMTYKINAADLKNHSITLNFSTDNIQNIIHFKNIAVSYEFKK